MVPILYYIIINRYVDKYYRRSRDENSLTLCVCGVALPSKAATGAGWDRWYLSRKLLSQFDSGYWPNLAAFTAWEMGKSLLRQPHGVLFGACLVKRCLRQVPHAS